MPQLLTDGSEHKMILDKEIHRDLLLQLINAATIPGNAIEAVLELKNAVTNAQLAEVTKEVKKK